MCAGSWVLHFDACGQQHRANRRAQAGVGTGSWCAVAVAVVALGTHVLNTLQSQLQRVIQPSQQNRLAHKIVLCKGSGAE